MKENQEIKINLSTILLGIAVIVICTMSFFMYTNLKDKESLNNQIESLNSKNSSLQSKVDESQEKNDNNSNISNVDNMTENSEELKNEINSLNEKVKQLEAEKNNSQNSTERKYFIEKIISWTPNTKSYDFDTKTWYPNDSAEYYIATDMNNNLCIVNSKKELVHKTDIVIDKLITSAYVSSDDEILTVIMEDSTAYNINIKTFEYNKYKYASGY